MQLKFFHTVAILSIAAASKVLATTPSSALDTLNSDIKSLDSSIAQWNGDFTTTGAIVSQSASILKDLASTTFAFQAAGHRSEADEPAVLSSLKTVATSVDHILTTVTGKLDKLSNIPFVKGFSINILKQVFKATGLLSKAVVAGAPASSSKDIKDLVDTAESHFQKILNQND